MTRNFAAGHRAGVLATAALLAGFCSAASVACAAEISVIGLFPGKAVLAVDGGSPKTYAVGNLIAAGVRLVEVSAGSATIDNNGKRETIEIGGYVNRARPADNATVTLQANGQGHFIAQGQINGGNLRLLVDTGATAIALPASEAKRLGIDYRNGRSGYVNTANGASHVYLVKLDTVKIGDIELHQVDAMVQESGLPFGLLGMSFLNRVEMRRNGEQMTLTKRY